MILQSLHTLYERLVRDEAYELSQPGFSPQKISFRIILFPDGSFHFQDARNKDMKGVLRPSRMIVPGDGQRSGMTPVPFLTWDNALYLLGLPPKGRSQEWANERFQASKKKHQDFLGSLHSHFLERVCSFFEKWQPENASDFPMLEEISTHYGIFGLGEEHQYLHQEPAIVRWFEAEWENNVEPDGVCLITGERAKIERLHPVIKGITPPKGKQQKDGPLVSVDKGSAAFASYLKEQGYNSPVSETAAFRYGTALNALLNGPLSSKHRIRIGDATCVFWTGERTDFEDAFAIISGSGSRAVREAQDDGLRLKLQKFLIALQKGREAYGDLAADPEHTPFFLLGLAPNAARISVRFFYRSSIRELLDHLRQHTSDIKIVREFEHPVGKRLADSEFPAWWEFLRETVRQGDDPPPLLAGALMRAILEGTPYPESLLSAVVRRTQIERHVNYLRAATIKAVLTRNHHLTISPMLDPDNTTPAYLRGRLFAVLEKIQEEGHREQTEGGSLTKTIRDTYFAAACATPASVLPRLQQLSTHHRRHLRPGRKVQFDQLLGDINDPLSPATNSVKSHTLEEQGLFILGYYHQRKDFFTRKEAAATPETTTATVAA